MVLATLVLSTTIGLLMLLVLDQWIRFMNRGITFEDDACTGLAITLSL